MRKKVISLFTLLAFVLFSISCYPIATKEIKTSANWQGKKGKIFSVVKTSGEYIEFSKENPGRISGDNITGTAIILSKEIILERGAIKKVRKHRDGRIFEVIDKEGKIYHVVGLLKEESYKVIFFVPYESSELVSIPLSEVNSLEIKRLSPLWTAIVIAVPIAIIVIGFLEGGFFPGFTITG